MERYSLNHLNNFITITDNHTGKTIGRIIPHNYGYDAVHLPINEDSDCGHWSTKQEALEAILRQKVKTKLESELATILNLIIKPQTSWKT